MTSTRAIRLNHMYDLITGAGQPLTRADVARKMGLRKTPYLVQLLDQLVADGHVYVISDTAPNGAIRYLYAATSLGGDR